MFAQREKVSIQRLLKVFADSQKLSRLKSQLVKSIYNNIFTFQTEKTFNSNTKNKLEAIFFARNNYCKQKLKNSSNKLFNNKKKLSFNSFSVVSVSIVIDKIY